MPIVEAARVLIPFIATFAVGVLLAPIIARELYRHKAWKKKAGKTKGLGDSTGTPIFNELHAVRETSAPRMGGVIIWLSVFVVAGVFSVLPFFSTHLFSNLDFVDRSQTWLPLAALLLGALFGLYDDVLEITRGADGLSLPLRLLFVAGIGAFAGWWFYEKLGVSSIGLPLIGPVELGLFFIPFFIIVVLSIYASGVIDGIDGLAGGVFAIIFMVYAGIAFSQGQTTLAALSAAISGGIFAFLWFNVPPARFYMSETGSMALTLALVLIAFSTDVLGEGVGVGVLPIIALPLTVTVLSVVLQVASKKLFKRKLFKVAPIHHHFEAIGWPPYKVTMRYWIITILAGVFGLSLALL